MSKPKKTVTKVVVTDDHTGTKKDDEAKGTRPKLDETEKHPFELRPGLTPTAAVPAWVLAVTVIVLCVVAWRSSRRKVTEITEDSREFLEALKIWLPWLMAKQSTPRAVKRFINRLRYIAIRLRKTTGGGKERFPDPTQSPWRRSIACSHAGLSRSPPSNW